jgi:hypothetical protein
MDAPREKIKLANACCIWDFTSYVDAVGEIIEHLQKIAKKWVVQQEKCPTTGRLHFQGRLSLKVKNRTEPFIPQGWCGVTHDYKSEHFDFYATKEETRVAGPWKDNELPRYIPRDVRKIEKLKDWQEILLAKIKFYEERKIIVIIDPTGGNGKSAFARFCMVHKFGQIIPMANDYKDILRIVCDAPISTCYFIDMPRAMRKEKLYQFYSAVETIKGGYSYDDRYSFKDMLFDPPNVVIFTNSMPDLTLLTRDRWQLFLLQNEVLSAIEINSSAGGLGAAL